MGNTKQPYGTVLIKASLILDYLAANEKPVSLNQIAQHTELTNSTVLKILDTLQLIGYVDKDPETKRYSLGTAIMRYAYKAMNHLEIKNIAQPHLEMLQQVTTETVHLGILDQNSVIYVTKLESNNPVNLYSQVGKNVPLYCSAMGKAILADQTNQFIQDYLKETELEKFTENTITDKETFLDEIEQVRKSGIAYDRCEHEEDVFCVGAAITVNGKNEGAFSVSVPKYRLTDESLKEIVEAVKVCKEKIEEELR